MKDFNTFVSDYITDSEQVLDEASSITFNNETFPKSGWCVILAGGAGSGKGYVQKTALLIDAKVFDVDKLKTLYVKAAKKGLIEDPKHGNYNFKNDKDVSELHSIIKTKEYRQTMYKYFFNDMNELKNKPNIIFDITGRDVKDIKEINKLTKEFGYKISLVWVVTNREIARKQNKSRDRVVNNDILNQIHNDVKLNVNRFILMDAGKYVDECWLFFNSTKKERSEMSEYEKKELHDNRAFKLKKKDGKFILPIDLQIKLNDITGPFVN
jgi:predicted kinase